jgi:hypothetical protein
MIPEMADAGDITLRYCPDSRLYIAFCTGGAVDYAHPNPAIALQMAMRFAKPSHDHAYDAVDAMMVSSSAVPLKEQWLEYLNDEMRIAKARAETVYNLIEKLSYIHAPLKR